MSDMNEDQKIDEVVTPPAMQDAEIFVPLGGDWDDKVEFFAAPASTADEIQQTLKSTPNISLTDTNQGRDWAAALKAGLTTVSFGNVFVNTLNREGSLFRQFVPSEKGPLSIAEPQFKHNTGAKLQGERALLRVRSLLKMGSIIQIPLWHSGFWITIKAPSEGALLELYRRLIEEKVNLGRQTYGLAFSNASSFLIGWVTDFVLNHIYDTSVADPNAKLGSLIATPDIPLIVWGLACAVWPNGFQYSRACIADPEKCNHVVKEKINVAKLLWTDTLSLTDWQIAHMANRGGSTMSLDAIKRYRDEFTRGKGRTIEISPQIKMTLKVPSLDDYTASGQRWINNIVTTIDRAFAQPDDDETRNSFITQHGKATMMRQFSHWVESIDVDGDIIDDVETMEQIIDAFSPLEEVRKSYFDQTKKFIDDSTIAVIAIPTHTCPACQAPQESKLPRYPHLLPIDIVSTFFTLLVPKLKRIQTR